MSPPDECAGAFRRIFFHYLLRRSTVALTVDEAWRRDEADKRWGLVACLPLTHVSTLLVESLGDGALVCPPHCKQVMSGLSMPPSQLIPGSGAHRRPDTMRPIALLSAPTSGTSAAAVSCRAKTASRDSLRSLPCENAVGAPRTRASASLGRRCRDAAE